MCECAQDVNLQNVAACVKSENDEQHLKGYPSN